MKWIKKGLIFNANKNSDWMCIYASVPIADHLEDDLFRIYFSTRDMKNRSSTTYLEINIKNPKKILLLSKNPVLVPGELGTFDDSGAMASCIVNHKEKK